MGWFDEQIKERKQLDDEAFSDSFINMAGAVMGGKVYSMLSDSRIRVKDSIDVILKYYHVKTREVPESITDVNEQLEYLLRPYGIMRRTVRLSKGWHKDAIGALLAVKKDDQSIVAMIPTGYAGYSFVDGNTGKRVKVTNKIEEEFEPDAIAFYKPFPLKKLGIPDLIKYMVQMLSAWDIALFAFATFVLTMVGMLITKLTNVLYKFVAPSKSVGTLIVVAVFMVTITVSMSLIGAIKTLFQSRINTKLNISVESATMMRVLSLPASFFKKFSSGELASRVGNMSLLCEMLVSSMLSSGLTSILSLIYITQIFTYAPGLVVPSLLILLATTVFSIISTFARMNVTRKTMELGAKESGMSYALISGVQKIKLSGSEKRAFARWGNLYAEESKYRYNPRTFLKANSTISLAITLIGTIVMYVEAYESGVSAADYIAFTVAFAYVTTAFSGLTGIAQNVAQIKPILEMVQPILETEPEIGEGKSVITNVSGSIELDNVCFRYVDSQPNIVDGMSFKIRPGQYVAIVGKTGCGKSTIIRLLLGFEKPQSGAIYIDGKDLESIDLKSMRRKIGVVMQEGKLFQGDIFSNITISAPWLTLDDAWEAAEMAGIADDIRRMPMGMHTIISEGSGGISGGQRQRLMIARAVAPKPKILIFDEATSALDNITQKKVSEALDGLKCTRIVIAHRLSTIKHCDRILCIDHGKIIEDGTYEELIKKDGFFAELVKRQRVDDKN